ncbi:hypothetical protein V8E36_003393 [Tilletia maclaganii]
MPSMLMMTSSVSCSSVVVLRALQSGLQQLHHAHAAACRLRCHWDTPYGYLLMRWLCRPFAACYCTRLRIFVSSQEGVTMYEAITFHPLHHHRSFIHPGPTSLSTLSTTTARQAAPITTTTQAASHSPFLSPLTFCFPQQQRTPAFAQNPRPQTLRRRAFSVFNTGAYATRLPFSRGRAPVFLSSLFAFFAASFSSSSVSLSSSLALLQPTPASSSSNCQTDRLGQSAAALHTSVPSYDAGDRDLQSTNPHRCRDLVKEQLRSGSSASQVRTIPLHLIKTHRRITRRRACLVPCVPA